MVMLLSLKLVLLKLNKYLFLSRRYANIALMRTYELILVLNSSLSGDQRKKVLDSIKSWLKEIKIVKEEDLGQKALAYAVKKEKIGFYCSLLFQADTIP